jgi:hypothetical protein
MPQSGNKRKKREKGLITVLFRIIFKSILRHRILKMKLSSDMFTARFILESGRAGEVTGNEMP